MPFLDGIDMERRAAFPALLDAWRSTAARHAARPAIEHANRILTYAELDRATNRFARWLIAQGGDAPIAMVAPLDASSIVAFLGTLKAGRIFVPFDPRDTEARIRAACARVGADQLPPDAVEASATASDADPGLRFGDDHPSIIYFSSGSTGEPCAALKSHGLLTMPLVYGFEPEDRCGLVITLAFGATINPMFGALCSGGTVCLFDPIEHGVPAMAEWLDRARISIVSTAPSVLRAAALSLESRGRRVTHLRRATVGGEPLRPAELEAIRRVFPSATIVNHYGSTEASFVACRVIPPDMPIGPAALTFGTIFPRQRITIVDERGDECPAGADGALVISGVSVALRYWGGPDDEGRWTADDGVRTFRTRDRGRFLPDGSLEHLGRIDNTIKVHGQMVDVGAVERALAAVDGVADAAVTSASGPSGGPRLVAYVVPATLPGPPVRDLRAAVAAAVPAFMVPSSIVRIKAMPRTDRGKIDRALLSAGAVSVAEEAPVGRDPKTPVEAELAASIASVFGVAEVGVDDDLFDLGLDSLSAHEVIDTVRARWDVSLTPRDFVAAPTVAALAARLDTAAGSRRGSVFPAFRGGHGTPLYFVPWIGVLSFAVRRLAVRLDRPTSVVAMWNDAGTPFMDRSVAHSAARLVDALVADRPTGPILLGGHSFGALVALEMARQLAAAGREPQLLVIIEPATGERGLADRWKRFLAIRPGLLGIAQRLSGSARRIVKRRWAAATAGVVSRAPVAARNVRRQLDQGNKRRYRPAPYAGPVLLVRTPEWSTYDHLDVTRYLTGDCRIVHATGDHTSVLFEPHVTSLARQIRAELERADRS